MTVSASRVLYEASGISVHSTHDKNKNASANTHWCITYFEKKFPGKEFFSLQSLFEEGDNGAHDLCGAIWWKIEGGTVIDNRVHPWNPLLGKTSYTTQEEHYLTVGIRLAKNPPEVDGDWKGNQLMASTITESWSWAREVFCELWTKDTLMTDADSWNDKENMGS